MISIETTLEKFNERFARYTELNKRAPDMLLEHKGRDLGIKLFEGLLCPPGKPPAILLK